MVGDERVVEVDADPVRIGFDRHAAVRVAGRESWQARKCSMVWETVNST
jgi:hypothetical protein